MIKKKVTEHKMCVSIFSATFVTLIIQHNTIKNVYRYSCAILTKLEISPKIFEKYSNPNFMNIRPVGAELFYADGWKDEQTDMTKLLIAFRKFANAPKMARYNATIVRTLSIS